MTCWLIEFKDGHKIIISEQLHTQELDRAWAGKELLVEAHWFDFAECRRRNRGVKIAGTF